MNNQAKKIYVVTGPKGAGKSTAIAYFLPPSKIHQALIVDTEDSMSDILDNMEKMGKSFGGYIRMCDYFTKGERTSILNAIAEGHPPWVESGVGQSALIKYWQHFIESLSDALAGNMDRPESERLIYLGIDTVEPIEAGASAKVDANKSDFGWSGQKSYGRRETEGVRPLIEGWMEGAHIDGIDIFGLSSHLKPVWEETGPGKVRRVANKIQMGGRIVVLSRLSSQMWWLAPNVGNADGAPAGIRIKARKGDTKIDEANDAWIHKTLLPARIPHFTWEDVRRYEQAGCDLLNPPENEIPTRAEMDMISEFLNEEQMKLMVIGAQTELERAKSSVQIARQHQQPPVDQAKLLLARNLLSEGKTLEEIEVALMNKFPPPVRASGEAERVVKPIIEALRASA